MFAAERYEASSDREHYDSTAHCYYNDQDQVWKHNAIYNISFELNALKVGLK